MAAKVGIIMGSISDRSVMEKAAKVLNELEVPFEMTVASAHRTPDRVREFVASAKDKGIRVFIAGAGWAAHLAGVLASLTELPIVAVPISSSPMQGLDALLASVQMPPGVPVAVMALDGARNAGIFAAQILALDDDALRERLVAFREKQAREVIEKARELEAQEY